MTFEEYWAKIEGLKALPNTAIKQIPMSLSSDTKERLTRYKPEDALEILLNAIEQVNHDCIESIDSLVKKRL